MLTRMMGTDRQTDGQTQVTTITLRPKRPRVKNTTNQRWCTLSLGFVEMFDVIVVLGHLYSDQHFSEKLCHDVWKSPGLISVRTGSSEFWVPAMARNRSRPKLNYGAGRDFGVGPEFGAMRKQPIIPGNSRARSTLACRWRRSGHVTHLRPG